MLISVMPCMKLYKNRAIKYSDLTFSSCLFSLNLPQVAKFLLCSTYVSLLQCVAPSLSNLEKWVLVKILSLDWITEKLFMCRALSKRSENLKILCCLHCSRQSDNDREKCQQIQLKIVKMSRWWNFFVKEPNYYKLWHFYWVSGKWHKISFGFLLAVFQFEEIKLSRWKKTLKRLHLSCRVFLAIFRRDSDADDGEHNFISSIL